VRAESPTAEDDDGTPIASSVIVGPILTPNLDEMDLTDMQAVLSADSGQVTAAVLLGPTAEIALQNSAIVTEEWSAGRNSTTLVARAAYAVYVRITSTKRWAMESIRMAVAGRGKVRRRGYK
jgi:hypothetical protein